jgi:phage terminase small subunit
MAGNFRSGRKRIPTALHVLRGTRAPGRAHEPVGPPGKPQPTPEVEADPLALEHWTALVDRLARMAVLTRAHREALATLCHLLAEQDRTIAHYRAMGYQPFIRDLHRDAQGTVRRETIRPNPLALRVVLLGREVLRGLAEFGLTPSSQSRVHAADTPPTRASRYITTPA